MAIESDYWHIPLESMKKYAELASNKQINKAAILGVSSFFNVFTAFIVRVTGNKNKVKFITNKEEAINWLTIK